MASRIATTPTFSHITSSTASPRPSHMIITSQNSLKKMIDEYAARRIRPVTVQTLKTFGQQEPLEKRLLLSAQYLKQELPARYAHMIKLSELTPMAGHIQMQGVTRVWQKSFESILSHPEPKTPDAVKAFGDLMRKIVTEESADAELIRSALVETRESHRGVISDFDEKYNRLDSLLDVIFGNRIGSRLLEKQHVAMTEIQSDRFVGLLDTQCNPAELCEMAAEDVRSMCEMSLGVAPKVIIDGHKNLTFPYFPTHVHYILTELIKNSARATVEFHGQNKSESELPPIVVTIANGKEDVTIRVSGRGGGIPRSWMKRIWKYSWTSSSEPTALAGYGFGLPLSRLYARYFGGDLRILSLDGWGTDAYLTLHRLGTYPEVVSRFYEDSDLNRKLKEFISKNEGHAGVLPLPGFTPKSPQPQPPLSKDMM